MVKIEGFNIICLDEFVIERRVNIHSVCKFKAYIREKDLNHSFSNLNKKVSVSIVKDGKEEKIFFGIVKSVECSTNRHGSKIEVEIISTSFLESLESKERIFQNPEKKLQNIFDCLNMKELKVDIADEGVKNEKTEVPIFQNKESNFEFIKRIAESLGSFIVIDDISNANINLKIGFSQQSKHDLNNEKYKIKSMKRDMNSEGIKVVLENQLFIGDILLFDNQEYEIESSVLKYEHGIYLYTYYGNLKKEKQKNLIQILDNREYEGEVTDNKDPEFRGRVKIKFNDPLEDCEPGEGYWFKFLTPYSGKDTGIVFLPEIGDMVSVKEISGTIYAENSGRVDTSEEYFKNPNIKTIKNMFDKSITLQEKMIEIKNGRGTEEDEKTNFIRLIDERLEIKVGDKRFIIDEERILLENKDVKLELTDKLILLCKESGIQVEGDKIKMQTSEFLTKSDSLKSENKEFEIKGSGSSLKGGSDMKVAGATVKIEGSPIKLN